MKYNYKNIFSFIVLSVLPQLSGFILIKVYADNLTVEEYGLFNTLMAVPPLLSVFMSMQLQSSISRFYFGCEDQYKKRLLGTIITLASISATLIMLLMWSLKDFIIDLLYPGNADNISNEINIVFLLSFVNVLVAMLNSLLVVKEKGSSIVKRVSIILLFQVLLIYIWVSLYEAKIYSILSIIFICSLMNFVLVYLQVRRYFVFSIDCRYIKNVLSYSFPLIFHQLGGYLFNFSSVLILANKLTLKEVALYSLLFKICSLEKIIVNSVNTAWQPSAFKQLTKSRSLGLLYIKKSYDDFIFFFILVYVVLICVLKIVVLYSLPVDYHSVIPYLPVMLGAYLFKSLYSFSTAVVFFDKKTALMPLVTLIVGGVNVFIVIMFSENYGFKIAVYSFSFSLFLMSMFFTIYTNKIYEVGFVFENIKICLLIGLYSYVFNGTNVPFEITVSVCSVIILSIIILKKKFTPNKINS